MNSIKYLVQLFLMFFVFVGFAQKSTIYTHQSVNYNSALTLYNKQQFNSAQLIFQSVLSSTSDSFLKSNATYYIANCAVMLNQPNAKFLLESFVKDAISKGRKVHFLPPYRYDNIFMLEQLTGIHNTKIKENVSMELVHAVISLREVKEECEIIEIDKACNVGYEMHVAAMQNAKLSHY